MATQSIIIYRNPAEAAFWESGLTVPFFAFMITFIILVSVSTTIVGKICRRMSKAEMVANYTAISLSFLASCFVFWKLM